MALLTVSDTRTPRDDEGGRALREAAEKAGHRVVRQAIVRDEAPAIRRFVEEAAADPAVDLVAVSGGTGLAPRDVTPEAVVPLFETPVPGFGEAFRRLSFDAIGAPGLLSRAEGGLVRGRLVVLLPGSPKGAVLGFERLALPVAAHVRDLATGR